MLRSFFRTQVGLACGAGRAGGGHAAASAAHRCEREGNTRTRGARARDPTTRGKLIRNHLSVTFELVHSIVITTYHAS